MLDYSAPSPIAQARDPSRAPTRHALTATTPPTATEPSAAATPEGRGSRLELVQTLLDAALQAQRDGTLDELVRAHPLATRWMMRRHGRVIGGTAGDSLPTDAAPQAAALLLRWLATQLRPDAEPGFDAIDENAWIHLPGWRPMLALASHTGFMPVPDYPRHYRRRAGEAPLDNLCGLWSVDPSTVYRMLERARHAMALVLADDGAGTLRRLSLRRFVAGELLQRLNLHTPPQQRAWHQRQAGLARAGADPASELWHHWQAADPARFIVALRQHATVLAPEPETEALVERVAALHLTPRERVDLWLARAALARTRNLAERELRAYEQASQVAQAAQDPLLLGIVTSALGKFYEPRDADRAFACYRDSAEFLRDLGPERGDEQALEHFVTTFARLAWLYLLRNDARSKAVLDRAEALRESQRIPDHVLGMLEQVWGEYWRRAREPARALEHIYRALNIFERLGDQRSVLATHLNLVQMHGEMGDHPRAIACAKVILDAQRRGVVEPALLVSTHLNLGAAHFWSGDASAAIAHYRAALDQSLDAGLRLHAFRARYNLAEAHYTRFRDQADPDDERVGDAFVREVLAAPASESIRNVVESARQLKTELLGQAPQAGELNRLLPAEDAVHFDEMTEVHRQRQVLAIPAAAEQHARAHLAIARAYAAIAAQEREAALALMARDGLDKHFGAELDELQRTFDREITREQQLAASWKQSAGELLDDHRRAAVLAHLLREGLVSKSGYAELAAVAPATASKHLALLAQRGLLVQSGKGPSTRYGLPA